jgi:sigma-B regulation protein RsbU (phosphoserine phosphatase)
MAPAEANRTIDELATALATVDSAQALFQRLGPMLEKIQALPAILYVRSGETLRPVAGFDCSHDVPAMPVGSLPSNERSGELPANQVPLVIRGEVVGMLAVFGRVGAESQALARCATIVAVKLRHLQHEDALRRELHQSNEQVAHLVAAGQLLQHLEIEPLLVKILESLLGAVRVHAGTVLMREGERSGPDRVATWGLRERTVLGLKMRDGSSFLDRVLAGGVAVQLGRDEIRALVSDPQLPPLGGLMALPLVARGRARGLALLGSAHEFSAAQRRMAEGLAGFAAIALDNALLVRAMVDSERIAQELSIARAVQEGMYPTRGLAAGGVLIEGSSRPAAETGGDYFTFLERQDSVLAMVGDVSGHGLGAALFAIMAHAIVQQQLRGGAGIAPASRALNEGLCHAQSGRFMTSVMVAIDPRTREFSYVSAGHCPLLWIHRGEPRWLDSSGMPLGIVLDNAFDLDQPQRLEPGDLLLLYTDGFTEAVNAAGEPFGEERLARAALQGWKLQVGPGELMMLINGEVDAWSQGRSHEDDLTMVVIAIARDAGATPTG